MTRVLAMLLLLSAITIAGCGRKGEPATPAPTEDAQEQPTS
ncbi:MAG: hypothetical protein AAF367_07825 [Pseudomonadota bacterium]